MPASNVASARSGSSASAGQRSGVGRPPGERVVLVVGHDLRALGQPRQADHHHELVGQADERLDGDPLGAPPTTPPQLAGERVRRVLARARSRRRRPAPSAPTRSRASSARRPGEPAPLVGAHHAGRGHALRRVGAGAAAAPSAPARARARAGRRAPRRTPAAPRSRRARASRGRAGPRSPSSAACRAGSPARRAPRSSAPRPRRRAHGPRARSPGVSGMAHRLDGCRGCDRDAGPRSHGPVRAGTASPRARRARPALPSVR